MSPAGERAYSQLCRAASVDPLPRASVASAFAVFSRVWEARCCLPAETWDKLPLSCQYLFGFVLMPSYWLTSTFINGRLSFFTEKTLVVLICCRAFLKRELSKQGCLPSRVQELAFCSALSIVLNCFELLLYLYTLYFFFA